MPTPYFYLPRGLWLFFLCFLFLLLIAFWLPLQLITFLCLLMLKLTLYVRSSPTLPWSPSIKQGLPSLIFIITYSLSHLCHDECLHCYGHPKIARKSSDHLGLSKLSKLGIVWIYHIFSSLPFTTNIINVMFLNLHGHYVRWSINTLTSYVSK